MCIVLETVLDLSWPCCLTQGLTKCGDFMLGWAEGHVLTCEEHVSWCLGWVWGERRGWYERHPSVQAQHTGSMLTSVLGFSRRMEPVVDRQIGRYIDNKKLSHVIMEASKSNLQVGQQAEGRRRAKCSSSKAVRQEEPMVCLKALR